MLLGRVGCWVLKAPFTKYSNKGLMGKIVRLVYIKTAVRGGRNVKQEVYAPVQWEAGYKNDLNDDVALVTIDVKGKLYTIPDRYIVNLYDDDMFYRPTYITARLGKFPQSYEFDDIVEEVRILLEKMTGMPIDPRDVSISRSFSGSSVLSYEEALVTEGERAAGINNGTYSSTSQKLKEAEEKAAEYKKKLQSYEKYFS